MESSIFQEWYLKAFAEGFTEGQVRITKFYIMQVLNYKFPNEQEQVSSFQKILESQNDLDGLEKWFIHALKSNTPAEFDAAIHA